MAGAAEVHGHEDGTESRDVLVDAFGALIVPGDLLNFEGKEESSHHENEADDNHDGSENRIGFGDEGGWDNHSDNNGEAEEAENPFEGEELLVFLFFFFGDS